MATKKKVHRTTVEYSDIGAIRHFRLMAEKGDMTEDALIVLESLLQCRLEKTRRLTTKEQKQIDRAVVHSVFIANLNYMNGGIKRVIDLHKGKIVRYVGTDKKNWKLEK